MIPYDLTPAWFNLYKCREYSFDWPCRVTSQTPFPIQSQTCDTGMTWGICPFVSTRVRTCVRFKQICCAGRRTINKKYMWIFYLFSPYSDVQIMQMCYPIMTLFIPRHRHRHCHSIPYLTLGVIPFDLTPCHLMPYDAKDQAAKDAARAKAAAAPAPAAQAAAPAPRRTAETRPRDKEIVASRVGGSNRKDLSQTLATPMIQFGDFPPIAESSRRYKGGTEDTSAATSTSPGADPRPCPPTVDVSKDAAGTGPYSDALTARPSVPTAPAPPNPTSTPLLAVTTEAQGSGDKREKGGLEEVGGSSNQGGSGVCSRPPPATPAETTTATTPTTQAHSHGQLLRPPPPLPPPAAKGLLSSSSLAGSVPIVPHAHTSWQPLPVGTTSPVFGTPTAGGAATGRTPPRGISNGVVRNGRVETSWGAVSSQATVHRDWAPSRGSPGSGSVSHHQRGNNFGASSAPAASATGPVGWNAPGVPASLNPMRVGGGIIGIVGANGGGNSVGGRLRSAPEGFAVNLGGAQGMQPQPTYSGLASRPTSMGLAASGGREGAHKGGNDSSQPQPTPAGLGASLAGGMTGGPLGGFVLGFQTPGVRQPPLVPGGSTWGGAGAGAVFSPEGGGSPGTVVAVVGGGLTPPDGQHLAQSPQTRSPVQQTPQPPPPPPLQSQSQHQHQHQHQRIFYGSYAGNVAAHGSATLVASTARHMQASGSVALATSTHSIASTSAAPAVAVTGTSPTLSGAGNSVLAAEAPPSIPSGSPTMWGMAPRPQQHGSGIVAPSQLTNPMLLSPPVSHAMRFGAATVPMGLGIRSPPMAGTVHGMLGRPPLAIMTNRQPQQLQQLQQQQLQQQQVGRAYLYVRRDILH